MTNRRRPAADNLRTFFQRSVSATYYCGNNVNPAGQTPFAADRWFCLEIRTMTNTVGQPNSELTLWRDDVLVGEYKTGTQRGRWLRDNFYSWGQYFQEEQGFDGFDFRSNADVLLKRVTLDAYYQVEHPAVLRPGSAGHPLRRRGHRHLTHRLPGALARRAPLLVRLSCIDDSGAVLKHVHTLGVPVAQAQRSY